MNHRLHLILSLILYLSVALEAQVQDLNINIPDGPKPWSSLDINRSDEQFQFAIVTDRTGGRRPGVFFTGVKKLNLLQPEFVMTVGDLIDGYTEDVPELDRQWDEFEDFIDSLQAPFFYTPGNHDITNAVMDSVYRARFGPTFYHFVYKDVLFMSLNSEDQARGAGRGTISDEQYDYIEKTLAEYPNVRWTMLFMHQPLWLQNDPIRWPDVEKLLAGREHTVFVGHVHRYVRYMRNNGRYYTLATTGGGSRLRGPALGEFDHVTWVTMTEDGPIMANLALDGIYSDDLVTEAGYDFISRLTGSYPLRISPLLMDGDHFEKGKISLEIRNPEDQPVFVQVKPRFNFDYSFFLPSDTITVGPNSVETIDMELESRRGERKPQDLPAQALAFDLTYAQDGSRMTFPFQYLVAPEKKRPIPETTTKPKIDGNLEEWPELPYAFGADDAADLAVEWGVQRDEQHLYIAARVTDNDLLANEDLAPDQRDYIGLVLNAEPIAIGAMRKGEGRYRNSLAIINAPGTKTVQMASMSNADQSLTLTSGCWATENGYVLELALPLSYVREKQGDQWQQLRINLIAMDRNPDSEENQIYFWRPDWGSNGNYVGSGLFFRD